MPLSEKSFADRLDRGNDMHAVIDAMTPPFNPTDANLAPGAFQSYLNGVESANDDVSTAESVLTPLTDDRFAAADALKDKALRLKDHVGANVAWKKYVKAVTTAADAVRGYRAPKKPAAPVPGAPVAPPKRARQGARSQQGFADLEKLFGKLIAQIKKVTGYTAAANSELRIVDIEAQDAAFTTLNDDVSTAEANLDEAQRIRKDYYDGENGLREKMKCIKKAVRSQYGAKSTQYAAVNAVKI